MDTLARARRVLRSARGVTVLAALTVAVLAFSAPANAASGPELIASTTAHQVKDKAGSAAVTGRVGVAAATNCVLSSSYPSLYDNGSGGLYVVGSGEYRCNNPVSRIELHVEVYRDNMLIHSKDSSAQQRPGFKLYSLTSILGPSCVPGTYYWDITGWVNGGALGSGRVRSTAVYFGC